MPLNEATIRATAKMYEIRDTMRRLLGNNYPPVCSNGGRS